MTNWSNSGSVWVAAGRLKSPWECWWVRTLYKPPHIRLLTQSDTNYGVKKMSQLDNSPNSGDTGDVSVLAYVAISSSVCLFIVSSYSAVAAVSGWAMPIFHKGVCSMLLVLVIAAFCLGSYRFDSLGWGAFSTLIPSTLALSIFPVHQSVFLFSGVLICALSVIVTMEVTATISDQRDYQARKNGAASTWALR